MTRRATMGKNRAGEINVNNVIIKKLTDDKLLVAYSVAKYGSEGNASYSFVLKRFTKDLKSVEEVIIPLPFSLGGSIEFVVSDDGDNLYFAVPVVLEIEKERESLLGKILGTKENVRAGMFVFVYTINFPSANYDFGILNIGNPNKKISSLVFKKSLRNKDSYLIGLMWTFNQKSFGADIVKLKISSDNEITLLDKTSVNVGNSEWQTFKQINDIYETKNNYLLVTTDMQAIQTSYRTNWGYVIYYEVTMSTAHPL